MKLFVTSNVGFTRSLVIFLLLILSSFLFVHSAFATTTPYLVTEGLVLNPPLIIGIGRSVFGKTLSFLTNPGDKLIISANPDGTGDIQVADTLQIYNFFQAANFNTYTYNYSTNSCTVKPLPPQDISYLRSPLFNTYLVGILDWCGRVKTIGSIYLVHISPDPTPTPTPIPTPFPSPTPTPTPIPTLTPTPTPTPVPKTPLILIPGIGGAELKVNEMKVWDEDDGHGGKFNYLYPENEKVWLNVDKAAAFGEDDYFDILRMKTDGITSEANIRITGNLLSHAYQGTIDFFISNGYTLNQDLFVFPYDWRKDISLTSPLLDQKINEIKTQTGSTKIDIIAHSMGGLVARNYIFDSLKAQNVRKLFTLGTPHLGSVDALKNLRYGGCLTKQGILSKLADFNICFGLIPSEVNDVVKNMIGVFQLAPSQAYFNFYSNDDNKHPYPYRTEAGGLNYTQIKNLLTDLNFNTPLFTPSEDFHLLDSSLSNTNGVDVTLIAGSGKNTLGQIVDENNHKDIRYINGDGTVPLFSASLVDASNGKSLLGNNAKVFYTSQDHGELVASDSALNLVKNILNDNSDLPDGVSDKPYSLPLVWWLFSKHSPVDMNIYDSLGNHTGPTADGFETNIPGSSYDTLGDEAFIFVPDNGTYNIKFQATDNGSFDFRVRKFENENTSQEILYNDVPLTTLTKAELTFNTSLGQNPIMYVDEDGNGTTDKEVSSYTSPNPTSTPTLTPTPQPTPTPTVILISQEKSAISEENNVLGAKINSQKEQNKNRKVLGNTEKKKNSPLTAFLIVLTGGITIFYFKFKR